MPLVLASLALVLAAAALVVAVLTARRGRRRTGDGEDALPQDVHGLRQEVAALRLEARDALKHLAVVRYDAFGDMGGRMSFSVAVIDDLGDGVVISSIHARGESRTYAKGIVGGGSDTALTPEEQQALAAARDDTSGRAGD